MKSYFQEGEQSQTHKERIETKIQLQTHMISYQIARRNVDLELFVVAKEQFDTTVSDSSC